MRSAMVVGLTSLGRTWPGSWGGAWPWGLFWLVLAFLFWGSLLALLIWAVRVASGPRHESAQRILKRRLASGEITQEEYERIRRLLED